MRSAIQQLIDRLSQSLAGEEGAQRQDDADLLTRLVRERDDAAFTAILRRHGRLVWGVCHGLLLNDADAEDAFQATFVALYQGAAKIRQQGALAPWLHGTATRIAKKARLAAARRTWRERLAARPESAPDVVSDDTWQALHFALHDEIARLAEPFRVAFVLCVLEGRRHEEAAALLGVPVGTLSARVSRARGRLLERLSARGLTPAVAVAVGAAAPSVAVPPALVAQLRSHLANGFASVPKSVLILANAVAGGSSMTVKWVVAVAVVGVLTAGVWGTWLAVAREKAAPQLGGESAATERDPQGPPAGGGRPQDRPAAGGKASDKVKDGLGEKALDILNGATRVEVFRLKGPERFGGFKPPKGEAAPKDVAQTIGSDKVQLAVAAIGKEKDSDFAARLRAFVVDEATGLEDFDDNAGSFGPHADVAFRLWKGKESVTVAVDFRECTFLVVARDASGKQTKTAIGEFIAYNRENRRYEKGDLFERIKALVVEALPDDAEVKEVRKPEVENTDLAERTVAILSGATRVEAFRVKPAGPKGKADIVGSNAEHRWAVTAAGEEQGKEFAAKLRAFLSEEACRRPSGGYVFYADVVLRLWKDKESVTVVVNLVGSSFLVIARDAEGKVLQSVEGGFLFDSEGGFDNGELYARIKALAVEALPDDETLRGVTDNLGGLLEKAEQFELLSLNPTRSEKDAKDTFHGYKALGKTTVKDAEVRKKLVAALKKGVEENNGAAAACFNPRHSIRLTHEGKTLDFVICYECLFMQVYAGDRLERDFRTTGSPGETFTDVLKAAKVPLPQN